MVLIFTHHRKFVYSVLPAGNCQTDSAGYVALAVTCFALLQSERKDSTVVLCARWVMDVCVSVKQASALTESILFSVVDSGYSTELKSVGQWPYTSPVETERSVRQ